MLKIRYQRIGRRNQAHFRIIVGDSTIGPKSGKFLEVLGSYNPKTKEATLKTERIKHWLSVGAQVSDTARGLLVKHKVIGGKKV